MLFGVPLKEAFLIIKTHPVLNLMVNKTYSEENVKIKTVYFVLGDKPECFSEKLGL